MYIINYHNILFGEADSFDQKLLRISQSQFEDEINFLIANYELVSVKEIVQNIDYITSNQLNKKIAITFDDGYLGTFKYALPILQKYNIPATFYVVSNYTNHHADYKYYDALEIAFRLTKTDKVDLSFLNLGICSIEQEELKIKSLKNVKKKMKMQEIVLRQKNEQLIQELLDVSVEEIEEYIHGKEKYLFMSWENLKFIISSGYDIGSHTCSHSTLSVIPLEDVYKELSMSYSTIKNNLDIDELSFAYPHGNNQHIGDLTPNLVKQIGYSFAVTAIPGEIDSQTNKLLINRMTFDKFLEYKRCSI
jgi:peptidoglycan/xylan/chitin deacetylase (PgdA/CDA1 family)